MSAYEQEIPLGHCDVHSMHYNDRDCGVTSQKCRHWNKGCCGTCCCRTHCKYRVRWVRSKAALLILVWQALLFGYLGTTHSFLTYFTLNTAHLSGYTWLLISLTEGVSMVLLYPLAGWLADVYFGRYKVICYSMWLLWTAICSATLSLLLLYCFHQSIVLHAALYYAAVPLTVVCMHVGMAGMKANLIVFGMDQLQDSSTDEISAFIAWFVWAEAFGLGIVTYFCGWSGFDRELSVMVQMIFQACCVTVVIALNFLLKGWLVIDPETPNPLRTVVQVLKYAGKNKGPHLRSAFTYCEKDIPSRVDFAKKKFGGPFFSEQVEDVKTFVRILILFTTFFGYYVGGEDVFSIAAHLNSWVSNSNVHGYCAGKLINLSAGNLFVPAMFAFVPVYEFLIYPLFHKHIPSMLKRAGVGIALMFGSVVSQLVLDGVGHRYTQHAVPCLLLPNATYSEITLDLDYRWFAIPSALGGLSLVVFYTSIYQFICAQTPHSMKGLMIGILYLLRGVFNIIRTVLILTFQYGFINSAFIFPSCGVWYYLLSALIVAAGFAVFCGVAKRYRKRERGELVYERIYVEAYYEQSPLIAGD